MPIMTRELTSQTSNKELAHHSVDRLNANLSFAPLALSGAYLALQLEAASSCTTANARCPFGLALVQKERGFSASYCVTGIDRWG